MAAGEGKRLLAVQDWLQKKLRSDGCDVPEDKILPPDKTVKIAECVQLLVGDYPEESQSAIAAAYLNPNTRVILQNLGMLHSILWYAEAKGWLEELKKVADNAIPVIAASMPSELFEKIRAPVAVKADPILIATLEHLAVSLAAKGDEENVNLLRSVIKHMKGTP